MRPLDRLWLEVMAAARSRTVDPYSVGRYHALVFAYGLMSGTSVRSVEDRVAVELRRR